MVELLVVIGIIALLISILLPSLGKARAAAATVKCSANLHSIVQAMQIYAAQWQGSFPGGAHTSARFVFNDPNAASPVYNPAYNDTTNVPEIVTLFDWATPLANVMGIKTNAGPLLADRQERYKTVVTAKIFTCPSNDVLGPPPAGFTPTYVPAGGDILPMPSYGSPMLFHLLPNIPTQSTLATGRTRGRADQSPPAGYSPKLARVGPAARKIFVADSSRYSDYTQQPNTSFNYNSSNGGTFGDQGAAFKFSKGWDRANAPGNTGATGTGPIDARVFWARHGKLQSFGKADSFRFNAAFFDGHVENLGDLEGSNPEFWAPRGTTVGANITQMQQDVLKRFYGDAAYSATITLP